MNEKALITGAGGFIGSHLVEAALQSGCEVRAFVRYNSAGSAGWLDRLPCRSDVEVVAGDIRDYGSVLRATRGCGRVFHLAALIGIPYSYESQLAYVRTNVEGTFNVLEAARELGTVNVLIISTSETYGTAQYVPIDEKHPAVGQSPYAATKIAADQLALSYYHSFELPVSIARPFNTYGPRQSQRAIIPAIIAQILSGQRTIRLGRLSPTRDLTFVKDTAEGILAVAHGAEFAGTATNIGRNEEISMGALALTIASLMNVEVLIEEDPARVRPEASEVERLRCDNRRILALTNWKPRYDLETGLGETIAWSRTHSDLTKAQDYAV